MEFYERRRHLIKTFLSQSLICIKIVFPNRSSFVHLQNYAKLFHRKVSVNKWPEQKFERRLQLIIPTPERWKVPSSKEALKVSRISIKLKN